MCHICVMSAEVGIRELRQDLSGYLRRVRRGERLIVTDRNRPVAMLTPLPADEDPVERLVAEGRATRPARAGHGIRPTRLSDPYAGTKALDEIRGDS